MAEKVAPARAVQKAAQGGALGKLLAFSVSLAVVPVASYFLSSKYVWNEDSRNSTWSAITAVVAANIVLASYIAISVLEDQGDQSIKAPPAKESESRKTR